MAPRSNKKRKDRLSAKAKALKKQLQYPVKTSLFAIIGALVLVVSLLYHSYSGDGKQDSMLNSTLAALLEAESKATVNPDLRVAIGFGSCKDIIVQSHEVLQSPPPSIPEHFFSISTREELLKVFAYFYRHGAAAERFISNSSLFAELVAAAEKAPGARHEIGGNAAVMANRFAKEGSKVLLGAQVSKSGRPLFSPLVQISGPFTDTDDVHLLLEYPAGQTWGSYTPPRANRFIIHNDHQNPLISSLEKFASQIEEFNPHLLVIGGLQMMDNFPMEPEKRRERLRKVKGLMESLPKETEIHFEMASYSDEPLLNDIVEYVIPYASSLGMNEQELQNLHSLRQFGKVSLVSESTPRIASILDQMRFVYKSLQSVADMEGKKKLTRLHVHTLAFHASMIERTSAWKNSMSALAKSVLTANRHTCGSNDIDLKKAKLIMDDAFSTSQDAKGKRIPFDENDPIVCWTEGYVEICVAPVLVCTDVLQTGGGGDNISSASLVFQV